MTIAALNTRKEELTNQVAPLVAKKNALYSNMDIEQPMSAEEKELNATIAKIYSEINSIIRLKRNLK
jgi:hypothetical protein